MILARLLLILTLLMPLTAVAQEEIVVGLSQNRVSITTNFDGSELLIFGAVKRTSPIPVEPLDVIVTVSGPSEPLTVWRKERRAGVWVNTDSVDIPGAPGFYAVATSGPLDQILTEAQDLRYRISTPRAIRFTAEPETDASAADREIFTEALIRIRSRQFMYQHLEGAVDIGEETLFRTTVALPANLTGGMYRVRVFLLRDRQMVTSHATEIRVGKVGLELWLSELSSRQPLLYGVFAVLIAVVAGWAANATFRALRSF